MNDIPTIDLRAELLDRHAGAIKASTGSRPRSRSRNGHSSAA